VIRVAGREFTRVAFEEAKLVSRGGKRSMSFIYTSTDNDTRLFFKVPSQKAEFNLEKAVLTYVRFKDAQCLLYIILTHFSVCKHVEISKVSSFADVDPTRTGGYGHGEWLATWISRH